MTETEKKVFARSLNIAQIVEFGIDSECYNIAALYLRWSVV